VAAVLTGPTLLAWPRGELTWGTTSVARMLRSVGRDSFYRLNPYLLNPPLYEFAARWRRLILPALAAAWLWRVAVVALSRERCRSPRARRMLWLSALAFGSALLAIAGHWTLFRTRHILLPLDRTAVYLVPLLTLAAAVPAAIHIDTPAGRASRRTVVAVLSVMACYFVLCLRLTWFKEWEWDANAKQLYSVVSYYHHRYGVREVWTNWRYTSAMLFYEAASGRESFAVLSQLEQYPSGKAVYVLYLPSGREFVESQGLKVVYQDEASGGAVAIHPGICLAVVR
jgi:hypothetical protein